MAFSWTTSRVPAGNPVSDACTRSIRTSLGRHARIGIITVLYTTHHSCALLATPFTRKYAPDLTEVLERGSFLLNLHRCLPSSHSKGTRSKGTCDNSSLTKIPFQKIFRNLTLSFKYYSTPRRDEWQRPTRNSLSTSLEGFRLGQNPSGRYGGDTEPTGFGLT